MIKAVAETAMPVALIEREARYDNVFGRAVMGECPRCCSMFVRKLGDGW